MFEIEQTYDLASLTVLCRAARKTVRRWVQVLRCAVWIVFVPGTALAVLELVQGTLSVSDWKLLLSLAVLLAFLLFEDRLNAWLALRQLVPGTAHSVTVFDDDAYTVTMDKSQARWEYDNITAICESERYFICFLGRKHGQIFDKQGFRRGECDAFRAWLAQKTGKTVKKIK